MGEQAAKEAAASAAWVATSTLEDLNSAAMLDAPWLLHI